MKKVIYLTLIMAAFLGCSKNDADLIELATTEITLNYGDEYQIEAESKSSIMYDIEDRYHGVVTLDGLIIAGFVGETNVSIWNNEDSKDIKLTVAPTSTLYPEPEIEYLVTTKDDIINEFGMPDTMSTNFLWYKNYSEAVSQCIFDINSNNAVTGYSVFVKTLYTTELETFLAERYKEINVASSYDKTFINNVVEGKATMVIRLAVLDSENIFVMYSPKNATK